jgi:protein-disulfide isomerase
MQNFSIVQRRWWVAATLVLLLVLTACVAQPPSAGSDAPDPKPTTGAAEEATAAATEESAEEATAEATEEAADEEAGESATEEATEEASEEATAEATEEAAEENAAPAVDAMALIGGAAIPSDETHKGLSVGFTEDGFAYRGNPDAPVVMIEYSDYGCPFCNRHFVQTEPAIDEAYVRSGEVRVVFHDFPLESLHPNAPAAHTASLCVADQGSAATFWEYRAELFRSVDEWQSSFEPLAIFASLAEEAGVDMAQYEACMSGGEKAAVVQARVDAAFERGFNATPSFHVVRPEDNAVFELIGAQPYEQFAATMDSALAGEMPVAAAPEPEPQQQGIPFWATAEGWQPDPDRPGVNMAGDQYRGSVDAPVTVIEFSDFQCPFCLRHSTETQPILDEKYVDTGKVLWVYKHFPLNIHPQAPAAGVAAECAGEQGSFWEMHEALFGSVEAWSIADPNAVFESLAEELALDGEAFSACLTDPEILARVNSDLAEGQQFVEGTPTFIIVRGEQGSIIPGALPEATFSEVLDGELAEAGVTD